LGFLFEPKSRLREPLKAGPKGLGVNQRAKLRRVGYFQKGSRCRSSFFGNANGA
jgi:hypothetical protein